MPAQVVDAVGVVDGAFILLYPESVYQFAAESMRRAGRQFPVEVNTLVRRLAEAGFIETEIESGCRRLKVNVWIGGATRRVIKLRLTALERPPLSV